MGSGTRSRRAPEASGSAPSSYVGGTDVLVLDTEGIDALDAECEHDVRIFSLAVLLCSALAYNSMSHLDEAAVQTLSLMTHVADTIGDGTHAPSLYWILRDFSLQLVDDRGQPISHSQYLEQALAPPTTKCATREAITKVFPVRHLVTFPRPNRGESAQRLDTHPPPSNPSLTSFSPSSATTCASTWHPFGSPGWRWEGRCTSNT